MSRRYTGLQARIKNLNPLAIYVPCGGHSLNLVGTSAVESISEVSQFSHYLEDFYNVFASSTHRWDLLTKQLARGQKVAKRVSGTRWSSRHNACSAFTHGWKEFIQVLRDIENDNSEQQITRRKAAGLQKVLAKFESVFNSR